MSLGLLNDELRFVQAFVNRVDNDDDRLRMSN